MRFFSNQSNSSNNVFKWFKDIINSIFFKSQKNDEQKRFDLFLIENEKTGLVREAYLRFIFVGILLCTEFLGIFLKRLGLKLDGAVFPSEFFDIFFKLGFIPIGILQLWLAKNSIYRPWMKYGFLLFDVVWLGLYQIIPNPFQFPFGSYEFTDEAIRTYNHQKLRWLFLIYAWAALYFSANYVRALGLYISAFWVGTYIFLSNLPGTIEKITLNASLGQPSKDEYTNLSGFVDIGITNDNILMTIFMTLGFSFVAQYHYKIVTKFFATEERRSALSRFFSPNLIEQLARNTDQKEKVNVNAAIAFTDMKNFTNFSQNKAPEEVLEVLQEFHSIIEAQVFKHNGTLEKYIGDAAMAVFGAPVQSNNDADNAVKCAIDWINEVDKWNKTRIENNKEAIKIGIGIDFGAVTAGIIGKNRNMSYAVVGATVNRASRLESATRTLIGDIIISNELFEALQNKSIFEKNGFSIEAKETELKNLEKQMVWVVKKQ